MRVGAVAHALGSLLDVLVITSDDLGRKPNAESSTLKYFIGLGHWKI